MSRPLARVLLALGALLAACAGALGAPTPAERELIDRYVPRVELRTQSAACDTSGEPYAPAAVEAVLGNPEVSLRGPGRGGPVVKKGPTAADLDGVAEDHYLDFPGDPRRPGCTYEKDFARFNAGRPRVTYAHIARQADEPGRIAVQYWLYYYFNDYNNTHESDWEFIQIVLPADSAEEALTVSPLEVGYAQHSGGESAAWSDAKLERDGDHPIVWVAAGSHASFFESRLYLGRSAAEGFGCDNTRGPSRRLPLEARFLPDDPAAPDAPAWMRFEGHWGELLPPPFDGPTGPTQKTQWTRPMEWQDALRSGSVAVPTGSALGPTVSGFFCGAVAAGSNALLVVSRAPAISLTLLALLVGGGAMAVRRAGWSLHAVPPLRARRSGGEIIRAAARAYRAHPATMLGLGVIFIPLGLIAAGLQAAIFTIEPVEQFVSLAGSRSALSSALALMVGGFGNLVGLALVGAAANVVLRDLDAGRAPSARRAWRAVGERILALILTVGRAAVIVVALLASIVGIPWGVQRLVRWLLTPSVVMLEGLSGREALARSHALVEGDTVEVAVRAWSINIIGLALAPVVAAPLLFLTALPLAAINLVGSLIYVLVIPFVGVAMTLIYGDRIARTRTEGAD